MRRAHLKASFATTFNFANPATDLHTPAHDVLARVMDIVTAWDDGLSGSSSHHFAVSWCGTQNEGNDVKLKVSFDDAYDNAIARHTSTAVEHTVGWTNAQAGETLVKGDDAEVMDKFTRADEGGQNVPAAAPQPDSGFSAAGPLPNVVETADAANGTSTAYAVQLGQTGQGTININGDRDWFSVELQAGQTYSFAMVGTGINNVVDPYLRLMDSTGLTELTFNDDGLPNNNSIFTYTAASTGTYYINAGSFDDIGTGQYGVSVTAGTRPSFDIPMGAGSIDADRTWAGAPGVGAVVTYAFRASPATYTVSGSNISTFTQLTQTEIDAVRAALQAWSEVSGITFVEVNPGGYSDSATILFANYTDSTDGAGAFAFFPGSTASTASAGDVWLNTNSIPTGSVITPGAYAYNAIVHEIGHALGLSHPGLYNAGPNQTITYANNAQFTEDTNQYSVMSYFDEANTGAQFFGYPESPMLFDVYAVQQIYGANTGTRVGNTTYGYNSNAGGIYDFNTNAIPAFTIWDGGGIDTINASGSLNDAIIDLNEGRFSSINSAIANVAIALGVVIENAIGGLGNDTIHGNEADNRIEGNAGADTLNGNGGNDTLIGGAGADTLSGGAGADILVLGSGTDIATGGAGIDTVQLEFTSAAGPQTSNVTDLAIGESISWQALQTVIVNGNPVQLASPIVAGNGSTTGLNQLEYAVVGGTTVLHFGLNSVAGADFSLSINGTFALSQFVVEQNNASGAVLRLVDGTAYSLSPVTTSVDEGVGTVTFTVTRSGGTPAETIFVSTTNTEGSTNSGDYTAIADQALVFAVGELSKTVTVSITNDTVFENTETYGLVVQRNNTDPDTTFLTKSTFTIQDNDPQPTTYALSPATTSVSEGVGTVTFTVTRSGATPAETIFVSTTNTEGSTNSGDYTAIADQALVFAVGELSKTVTVSITNDTVFESNETFGLVAQRNSTDPDTTFLTKSTFTIQDNDPQPTTYALSPATTSVSEGVGTVTFTVTRSGGTPAETIFVSTTNTEGSTNSGDYTAIADQALVFAAGELTKTVTVSITNDTVFENTETYGLVAQRNSTDPDTTFLTKSTFTIQDNDASGPDTTAPLLTSTSPADNASSVATNANIVLTFNEPVKAGTGSITIINSTGGTALPPISITDTSQVTFSGNTVTINPTADLSPNAEYVVLMFIPGTITDSAGNNFGALSNPINFTTGSGPAAGTTYSLSPVTTSVDEGVGTVTFTVTRSGGTPAETIFVSTTNTEGSTNSGDYTAIADQALVFAAGELTKTVTVSITNDTVFESNETYGLVAQRNSTDPDTTFLTKSTFTIQDNDPQPTTYALSPVTTSVSEGVGTVTFTVTRSGGTPAETIFVSTTNTEGSTNSGDYTAIADQALVFAAGELTKTVTVSITNDTVFESNETYGLVAQRNSTDPDTTFLTKSTFTIQDNDPQPTTYALSPVTTSVSEGVGTVTFTVTRSGGTPAETIFVSTTNTEGSTNSGDYTAIADQALVFAAGELTKTVTVSITNDTVFESNETYGLVAQRNSTDPDTTFLTKSTFTIQDNDPQPTTYALSPATTSVSEGVGTVTFTVTRSGGTPAETIFVSTTNTEGSTNSGDYTAIADQALVFAAGELTKTVTVSITNDTVFESTETFGLVAQRNSTDPDTTFLTKSTFTIQDNDPQPTTYALSPVTTSVSEGVGTVTFTVTRSGGTPAETIFVSTTNTEGSTNSGDYTAIADQALVFAVGELSKTVTVSITNDTVFESNETYGLVAQRNSTDPDTTFLTKSTFTIQDNDPQPTTYALSPATTSVSEGVGTVTFTVTRSGGTPAETIFVSTTNTEGSTNSGDYTAIADQALVFAVGELSKTVTVSITNDTVFESNETFGLVAQRNSTDPDTTFLTKSTFTIQDNDPQPTTYALSPATTSVSEGVGTVTFTVTRSGGTPAETIFVSTTNTEGSTNSGDYTAIADQALVFAAGELTKTVTVSITNDTVFENTETYGLVAQRNSTDPDTTFLTKSTFTIQDNDASGPDTTAPLLTSTSPADNASSVATNANIVLTFNEPVKAGTGSITIINSTGGTALPPISITDTSQVTFSGNTVTINPTADLSPNAEYVVLMFIPGTITDSAGNNFGVLSNPINFTTGSGPAAATQAANAISGTPGNDLLFGTSANDIFVFADNGGTDTIQGFDQVGDDTIQLSISGITTFSQVQAVMTQSGADVFIDFATTDIVLVNTTLASMGADDFTFV